MDSEYLKSSVGPQLASALAKVVLDRPQYPVSYLAECLLSQLQDEARKVEAVRKAEMLEVERAEYAARIERERIMREEEERKMEEERLRLEAIEAEKKRTQNLSLFKSLGERLVHAVAEDTRDEASIRHETVLSAIKEVEQSYWKEAANIEKASDEIHASLRAVFYLVGYSPEQVKEWQECRKILADGKLLQRMFRTTPSSAASTQKFKRAEAASVGLIKTEIAETSFLIAALLEWASANTSVRNTAAKERKMAIKKQKSEEAKEEEEEDEDEEKSSDEDEDEEKTEEGKVVVEEEAKEEVQEEESADEDYEEVDIRREFVICAPAGFTVSDETEEVEEDDGLITLSDDDEEEEEEEEEDEDEEEED